MDSFAMAETSLDFHALNDRRQETNMPTTAVCDFLACRSVSVMVTTISACRWGVLHVC